LFIKLILTICLLIFFSIHPLTFDFYIKFGSYFFYCYFFLILFLIETLFFNFIPYNLILFFCAKFGSHSFQIYFFFFLNLFLVDFFLKFLSLIVLDGWKLDIVIFLGLSFIV
jgi:hypothetical protein